MPLNAGAKEEIFLHFHIHKWVTKMRQDKKKQSKRMKKKEKMLNSRQHYYHHHQHHQFIEIERNSFFFFFVKDFEKFLPLGIMRHRVYENASTSPYILSYLQDEIMMKQFVVKETKKISLSARKLFTYP